MKTKLTQTSMRKEVSEALGPIRKALHACTDTPKVPIVQLRGYTFTGVRLYKAPGQTGYVWMPHYKGHDKHGRLVFSGTLAQVSEALFRSLQAVN